MSLGVAALAAACAAVGCAAVAVLRSEGAAWVACAACAAAAWVATPPGPRLAASAADGGAPEAGLKSGFVKEIVDISGFG